MLPTVTESGDEWYPEQVFIRITPEAGSAAFDRAIWYFEGAVAGVLGSAETETPLVDGKVDVRVLVAGVSKFWYFPITADGEMGDPQSVDLWLDLEPPHAAFTLWPTPSGIGPGNVHWYNDDVTATYVVDDVNGSGAVEETGTVTITGTGTGLTTTFEVFDNVGHSETSNSATATGGRLVNIDRQGPIVQPPGDLQVVADINGNATVPASFGTGGLATDALSGVNGPVVGSGPATLTVGQTITWTFTAVDVAGNVGTATASVTAASSALEYTGLRLVEYGNPLSVAAEIQPPGASGLVQFTLISTDPTPGRGTRVVTAPVSGGIAATTIPTIVNHVGNYQLRVEYLGTDLAPPPAPTTANITVSKTPISIIAHPNQGKAYGESDPPLTRHVSGALYHPDDVVTGAVTRVAGENVLADGYDILPGTLAVNANYNIVFTSDKFRITALPISVAVNSVSRVFGVANPAAFDVTVTGTPGAAPLQYDHQHRRHPVQQRGGGRIPDCDHRRRQPELPGVVCEWHADGDAARGPGQRQQPDQAAGAARSGVDLHRGRADGDHRSRERQPGDGIAGYAPPVRRLAVIRLPIPGRAR